MENLVYLFVELGDGWKPAVIWSDRQVDDFKAGQQNYKKEVTSYWIGAITRNQPGTILGSRFDL